MSKKIFKSGELEFAYDDTNFNCAAARIAKQFGVMLTQDSPGKINSMGWPTVRVVGELPDVSRCIREMWATGDQESDDEIHANALAYGDFIS